MEFNERELRVIREALLHYQHCERAGEVLADDAARTLKGWDREYARDLYFRFLHQTPYVGERGEVQVNLDGTVEVVDK